MLKTFAIGRFTKDPELKYQDIKGEQTAICTFSLACDVGYGDKTEYLDITAWRGQAEHIAQYGAKGRLVYAELSPNTNKWEQKYGDQMVKRQRVEYSVNFFKWLDSNPKTNNSSANNSAPVDTSNNAGDFNVEDDDDVPF